MGFGSLLVVGHAGKLVKVAAGVMNTHSRVADARRETMAAHAALSGASHNAIRSLMESTTTDEDIDILISEGILDEVMESIMERINFQLNHRVGDGPMIEAVMFSKVHGLLGTTPGADELIARNKMSTADRPVPAEENERGKP
jgi:cobalt-precorrin-5B (C1)-methyltransferase